MFKKINSQISINSTPVNCIDKIIAIGSGKGGVGKCTISANLAIALARCGKTVGLLDADVYGPTQATMFGHGNTNAEIDNHNKVIPISAHGIKFIAVNSIIDCSKPLILRAPIATKLVHTLLQEINWGYLDYLLIDLPPGTGDIQLTITQQAKLAGAIIVTTPQEVAINIAAKGLAMFQRVNVPILGIVENMAGFTCNNCGHITNIFAANNEASSACATFADSQQTMLLAHIPLNREIVVASDSGQPIADLAINQLFDGLASKIDSILGYEKPSYKTNSNSATTQEPDQIEIITGNLILTWDQSSADKIIQTFSAYNLRLNCKCALCVSETTGGTLLDKDSIAADIYLKSAQPIGRYGLKLTFSDGHNTGIYTFAEFLKLRDITIQN